MRILAAVDQYPYSARAVSLMSELARNTWANLTLLAVASGKGGRGRASRAALQAGRMETALVNALRGYRRDFWEAFSSEDSPYKKQKCDYELFEIQRGVWEELYVCRSNPKEFKVLMRFGNPAREILAESQAADTDLIILGADRENNGQWTDAGSVPHKVASEANCSVLVVKAEKKLNRMVCCLDHDRVSQESLEMINQMVTLNKAELDIVGLTEGEGLKIEVERRMDRILRYYTARRIQPRIELVELSALEGFISQEGRWGFMALWMGKKSILEKVFSRAKVDKLIRASESSILLLR